MAGYIMLLRGLAGFLSLTSILVGIGSLVLMLANNWWQAFSHVSLIITGLFFGMYALRGNKWSTYGRDVAKLISKSKRR